MSSALSHAYDYPIYDEFETKTERTYEIQFKERGLLIDDCLIILKVIMFSIILEVFLQMK